MQSLFIEYVYLILIILALVMLANKLKLAYPIVLVLGGLALSFTSVFSHVTIDPELVFLIFLPRFCMKQHGKRPGKSSGNGGA